MILVSVRDDEIQIKLGILKIISWYVVIHYILAISLISPSNMKDMTDLKVKKTGNIGSIRREGKMMQLNFFSFLYYSKLENKFFLYYSDHHKV